MISFEFNKIDIALNQKNIIHPDLRDAYGVLISGFKSEIFH
jgi:hypothetical protein